MRSRTLALLALLLILLPAEVMAARGFGGGRSGGFGGFGGRSSRPSGGFGGFGGFRSTRPSPSPSSEPSSGFGGFRGRSTPPAASAAPEMTPGGLSATPRAAPFPSTSTGSRPGGSAPAASSIETAPPLSRPGVSGAPSTSGTTASPRSSIGGPLPSAVPRADRRGGIQRPQTRSLPGPSQSLPPVRPGWGGVYVPYGYSYWHYAPYHYLWWMGWANPYPSYYGGPSHAGFFTSLLVTLVMLAVFAAIIGLGVMLFRRPRAASYASREWPPRGWDSEVPGSKRDRD